MGEPILHFPDLNGEYRIETDASAQGFGAVLSQEHEGVTFVQLRSPDKTTDKYERLYGPTELEAAAITFATKKFRTFDTEVGRVSYTQIIMGCNIFAVLHSRISEFNDGR